MDKNRQLRMFQQIALISMVVSSISCASKSDLAKLREELLSDVASTRSSMEQRIGRTTTQFDVHKQQESVAVQSQFKDLQQQVENLRHSIEAKLQVLEQVLTRTLLIEENELKNRLKVLDKSVQDLDRMSRESAKER